MNIPPFSIFLGNNHTRLFLHSWMTYRTLFVRYFCQQLEISWWSYTGNILAIFLLCTKIKVRGEIRKHVTWPLPSWCLWPTGRGQIVTSRVMLMACACMVRTMERVRMARDPWGLIKAGSWRREGEFGESLGLWTFQVEGIPGGKVQRQENQGKASQGRLGLWGGECPISQDLFRSLLIYFLKFVDRMDSL